MTPVRKLNPPERVAAGQIVVGDRVSRLKRGPYCLVMATIPGEAAVFLHLETMVDGKRIGFHRIRPNHETKLWRR